MFFRNQRYKHVRFALRLALFAMLLPTLVPLLHHPMQMVAVNGLRICSAAPNTYTQTEPGKAPVSKSVCPVCFTLHLLNSGFIPPTIETAAVFFGANQDLAPREEKVALRAAVWPGLRSRAPPAFA